MEIYFLHIEEGNFLRPTTHRLIYLQTLFFPAFSLAISLSASPLLLLTLIRLVLAALLLPGPAGSPVFEAWLYENW